MVKSRINNTCQRGPEGGYSALRALVLGVRGTRRFQTAHDLTRTSMKLDTKFGNRRTKTAAVHWRHTHTQTHTHTDTQWKLRVYKATFIPMLTYGMESATLTQPQANRLNAFHCQCLRKILNHKATYYTEVLDPTAPTVNNQAILDEANIPQLTDIIATQQLKLLGHILREPFSELTRNVSFTKAFIYRGRGGKQRRGRRRFHWIEETCKMAWRLLEVSQPQFAYNAYNPPHTFLKLSQWASHRADWQKLIHLPTCSE